MKKIFIILGLILFIWLIMFIINYNKCEKLEKPVFMIEDKYLITTDEERDYNINRYLGLGYTIVTEEHKYDDIIFNSEMFLFGIRIKESTR